MRNVVVTEAFYNGFIKKICVEVLPRFITTPTSGDAGCSRGHICMLNYPPPVRVSLATTIEVPVYLTNKDLRPQHVSSA